MLWCLDHTTCRYGRCNNTIQVPPEPGPGCRRIRSRTTKHPATRSDLRRPDTSPPSGRRQVRLRLCPPPTTTTRLNPGRMPSGCRRRPEAATRFSSARQPWAEVVAVCPLPRPPRPPKHSSTVCSRRSPSSSAGHSRPACRRPSAAYRGTGSCPTGSGCATAPAVANPWTVRRSPTGGRPRPTRISRWSPGSPTACRPWLPACSSWPASPNPSPRTTLVARLSFLPGYCRPFRPVEGKAAVRQNAASNTV